MSNTKREKSLLDCNTVQLHRWLLNISGETALKLGAAGTSETVVNTYKTTEYRNTKHKILTFTSTKTSDIIHKLTPHVVIFFSLLF
jgi:hypothetical protein